ncbi:hypothetical protein, conserved in T.vivax [Trypanosoma vivax Y486]|uniref:Uncharacterized protein n=1 Tax=Trypanosoma vivax (strain Y486) TaxID=1055687 RepID=F9WSG7_TRYVY|nr:hypothetical protein, conserved in T.vivax [Trypanosoma vivax Y486]|eukprot:CCD20506.1 hypothetical protein, conserved in T.vivax [Trypanosoma vivax Y486]
MEARGFARWLVAALVFWSAGTQGAAPNSLGNNAAASICTFAGTVAKGRALALGLGEVADAQAAHARGALATLESALEAGKALGLGEEHAEMQALTHRARAAQAALERLEATRAGLTKAAAVLLKAYTHVEDYMTTAGSIWTTNAGSGRSCLTATRNLNGSGNNVGHEAVDAHLKAVCAAVFGDEPAAIKRKLLTATAGKRANSTTHDIDTLLDSVKTLKVKERLCLAWTSGTNQGPCSAGERTGRDSEGDEDNNLFDAESDGSQCPLLTVFGGGRQGMALKGAGKLQLFGVLEGTKERNKVALGINNEATLQVGDTGATLHSCGVALDLAAVELSNNESGACGAQGVACFISQQETRQLVATLVRARQQQSTRNRGTIARQQSQDRRGADAGDTEEQRTTSSEGGEAATNGEQNALEGAAPGTQRRAENTAHDGSWVHSVALAVWTLHATARSANTCLS